jgi:hypothetical protein
MARGNTKKHANKAACSHCSVPATPFNSASIFLVDKVTCDFFFSLDNGKGQIGEAVVAKAFAAQTLDEAFAKVALSASPMLGPRPRVDSITGSFVYPTNKRHAFFVCATNPELFDKAQGMHRVTIERLLGPREYNINDTKYLLHPRLRYLKRPAIMEIARFARQACAQETINMIRADDLLTYGEQTQIESQ